MRKAERLFQILTLLRGRRTVITAKDLAERLQVSERTVYRDIQALSLSGVPIEAETGVGYRLHTSFNLPPIMFDLDELEALLLGVRMVQGWSDESLGRAADSALNKIRAVLPERQHHEHTIRPEWLIVPDFYRDQSAPYSRELRAAIKSQSVLELSYRREDRAASVRHIWPLGLVYWGRTWTLVAWCELREAYRMFRLDRIVALTILERHFTTSSTLSLQHYLALQTKRCEEQA
ncbi:helix-turn-helix transcriptional regulator [Neptunomonas concharum]|uniref:YafY family transcriptional regulator n=1 Tax=Neptunomonas concharum TaxID=1031538 RepID=A0A5P1R7M8_9GAMM|nr:YafY family protein [Neptunomonas concharum]QEQ95286.1 YafY family transcriptional regulator [Neptunomonas concharum]